MIIVYIGHLVYRMSEKVRGKKLPKSKVTFSDALFCHNISPNPRGGEHKAN